MDWTPYLPYAIPALIASLGIVAKVAGDLSTQAEAKQSSRVARIEGTVSRESASIAAELATAKEAGTTADVLAAVKAAAVATGADYMLTTMPSTLKDAGATKDSLIAMLHGEVSKQQLATAAPALLAAANVLLPDTATPPAAPAPAAPAAAAA